MFLNFDDLVKSQKTPFLVIPGFTGVTTFYESINFAYLQYPKTGLTPYFQSLLEKARVPEVSPSIFILAPE